MTAKNPRLYSVILAAGASSRFGSPKQLAQIDGESLVRRATRLATELTGDRTLLVVGAAWQPVVGEALPFAGFVICNERHADGIGSSLACGVRAASGVADAIIVMLADQPAITDAHLQALQAAWSSHPGHIVATRYAGIDGVPAIFPATYFPELMGLHGDVGARRVIRQHAPRVVAVEFADAATDIDTPEDLALLAGSD